MSTTSLLGPFAGARSADAHPGLAAERLTPLPLRRALLQEGGNPLDRVFRLEADREHGRKVVECPLEAHVLGSIERAFTQGDDQGALGRNRFDQLFDGRVELVRLSYPVDEAPSLTFRRRNAPTRQHELESDLARNVALDDRRDPLPRKRRDRRCPSGRRPLPRSWTRPSREPGRFPVRPPS